MNDRFYKLKLQLDSLAVFSQIKKDPVIRKLRRLLKALCANDTEAAVAGLGLLCGGAAAPHRQPYRVCKEQGNGGR